MQTFYTVQSLAGFIADTKAGDLTGWTQNVMDSACYLSRLGAITVAEKQKPELQAFAVMVTKTGKILKVRK